MEVIPFIFGELCFNLQGGADFEKIYENSQFYDGFGNCYVDSGPTFNVIVI